MKRDDQILPFRLQADEDREKLARELRDKDRALNANVEGAPDESDAAMHEVDEEDELTEGYKTIVIHPGSQFLRIGLASDALPKTVAMAIASPFPHTESDESVGYEPLPKRQKMDDWKAEDQFGEHFNKKFAKMSADLKVDMRANKRKVLPNSKELAITYNKRTPPEQISEHNDPLRIDWTDIGAGTKDDVRIGLEAQRVPDDSKPPYRLWWPIQHGVVNEKDYWSRERLFNELEEIIIRTIEKELGIKYVNLHDYSCIWVVPDLYDKVYVEELLHMSFAHLEFKKVCFAQESLCATFGAGATIACVVDVGAQKTSIACVDEGLILEESRINLKYGGYDITETFLKMMLHDSFPYADINLRRRYDFLLAEELKCAYCTLNQGDIAVQTYNFHLRAPNQPTYKYHFKTYDETILAPMGLFDPSIFDNSRKLAGRRSLIARHNNFYDPETPDDPISTAQLEVYKYIKPQLGADRPSATGEVPSTPHKANGHLRMEIDLNGSSAVNSAAASPAPEGTPTPANGINGGSPGPNVDDSHTGTPAPSGPHIEPCSAEDLAEERDAIVPVIPLDLAVIMSIQHAVNKTADDRTKRLRDFLGGIMVIGGGAKIPGFGTFLEERLKSKRPDWADKVLVGMTPKDLDGQVVVWKGASVFGRMKAHQSWISPLEYEKLGARILHSRAIWFY